MDRRDFLRTSALAGAGIAAGTMPAAAKTPKPYHVARNGKARMKLTFFPYELQLRHTFTVATYSRTTTPDVQVEIEYDGFTGYGEASMPPYLGHTVESVCAFLSKVDLSQFADPFQLEDILAYVDSLSDGDAPAKAAVDIALHDLVGKMMGQPWFRIWGLDAAKAPSTTFTIGIDTPDVVRAKTLECAGRFNILKCKVGRENDKEMIETIREITDLPIAVDANQGWSHPDASQTQRIADREHAQEEIHWLKEHGVIMVEQPLAKTHLDDLAWLTERSPLPIIADESVQRLPDVQRLHGAVSGINIKLMKCTGLAEARKMITVAKSLDMRIMLGCMTETSCAVTAAAQLAPMADFLDLDGNLLITNDPFTGGATVVDGRITLQSGAGLGITSSFGLPKLK